MSLLKFAEGMDLWKKIVGGVMATIAAIGIGASVARWADARWDQRAFAADVKELKGRLDYQTNAILKGQAEAKLDQAQGDLEKFKARPADEKASFSGQKYLESLHNRIRRASEEMRAIQDNLDAARRQRK